MIAQLVVWLLILLASALVVALLGAVLAPRWPVRPDPFSDAFGDQPHFPPVEGAATRTANERLPQAGRARG